LFQLFFLSLHRETINGYKKHMVKIEIYKNKEGKLLVIHKCKNDDLIGEVYSNGIEKRGHWDMRARFRHKDNEATSHRVCEYFGFKTSDLWWSRF